LTGFSETIKKGYIHERFLLFCKSVIMRIIKNNVIYKVFAYINQQKG